MSRRERCSGRRGSSCRASPAIRRSAAPPRGSDWRGLAGVHWPRRWRCRQARPATHAVAGLGGVEAGPGPLHDQAPLEFRQGAKDMEEQASAGRGGVDGLGEGTEADSPFVQIFDGLDQLAHRARQPVKAPHDEGVAFPHPVERGLDLRSLTSGARRGFLKDATASGLFQCIALQSRGLVRGRDPCVADKHVACVQKAAGTMVPGRLVARRVSRHRMAVGPS